MQDADRLLAEHSPLVMFELRHAAGVNLDLPRMFADRGYGLYRLLGPDSLLVPARAEESFDPFELNLFACKPDRAAALAEARLLVRRPAAALPPLDGRGLALLEQQFFTTPSAWPSRVAPTRPTAARSMLTHSGAMRRKTRPSAVPRWQ